MFQFLKQKPCWHVLSSNPVGNTQNPFSDWLHKCQRIHFLSTLLKKIFQKEFSEICEPHKMMERVGDTNEKYEILGKKLFFCFYCLNLLWHETTSLHFKTPGLCSNSFSKTCYHYITAICSWQKISLSHFLSGFKLKTNLVNRLASRTFPTYQCFSKEFKRPLPFIDFRFDWSDVPRAGYSSNINVAVI